ncbi:MAG: hypothetical protein ACJ72E_07695 [Marmoricola sp.]
MSSLAYPNKVRAPRSAAASIERARLALVPTRSSRAPRAPFAVLVFLVLGAGVVGLLVFNTHMQQASFYATSLQKRADALAAKRQQLEMEMAQLRSPQSLALAARKRGMVVPPNPADLNLATGKIDGEPVAAGTGDGMRVAIPPKRKPSAINPAPRIRKIYLPGSKNPVGTTKVGTTKTGTRNSGQSQAHHGPASP